MSLKHCFRQRILFLENKDISDPNHFNFCERVAVYVFKSNNIDAYVNYLCLVSSS